MVYIEEVVLDNMLINCALLFISVKILRAKTRWYRILFSAAIGTVFAVFLPFIDKAVVVYKLGALVGTVLFATKHKSIKRYLLFTLIFAAVSFAAGGAAYGLFNLSVGKNGAVVYPQGKAVKYAVGGAILFLWVVLRQIGRFAARGRISASKGVAAEILIGDIALNVDCFDDTGNRLVDSVTSKPVAVLSHDVGEHYVGEGARTLSVHTVGGVKNLPVVTADKLTVKCASGDRVYEKMPLVVADSDFDGYKLIINLGAL